MATKFTRNDDANINMTSFHGVEIDGSLEKLTRILGAPMVSDGDDKVIHEWIMEGDDGTVATVYDWKCNGAYEKHWHVGGHDRLACMKFVSWFNSQV